MRINKSKPRPKSFAALYPTGRELLPWLRERNACREACRWVRRNQDEPFAWLWFNCPWAGWLLWLVMALSVTENQAEKYNAIVGEYTRDGIATPEKARAIVASHWPP